ncbi:MAG: YIP1 family protein [Chloroflexi bacterium]|nr:YIP1 family protein [Chloroflexota bacterium]
MKAISTLFAMLDRPEAALKSVAEHPRRWLVMALLLVLSLAALTFVSTDRAVALANERSQVMIERLVESMPADQAEAVRARAGARSMTPSQYWLTALGGGALLAFIGWAVRGAVIHFSSMALGGTSSWPGTFAMTVWTSFPFMVRNIVQTVYVAVAGELIEHQGLSAFVASGDWLQNSRDITYNLLSRIDPFTLWFLVVSTAGVAAATKVSKGKAALLVIVLWVVGLGLGVIPVWIGRRFLPG